MVKAMEDWEFSSFRDYAGLRNGTLCDFRLAESILGLKIEGFIEESRMIMRDDVQKLIH
ncbi:conserved hypothetical protein [Imperialibacter sp. EC-SDR9]|nr:conserved hypothetical protein [Imperialibacter sp. 75]CAD5275618.1 conserved hypothetical protein [Imperialibacter sp. 89]VVT08321.1 conserved hypothetical protein [Imperialibacter sp. EC-SDR9]